MGDGEDDFVTKSHGRSKCDKGSGGRGSSNYAWHHSQIAPWLIDVRLTGKNKLKLSGNRTSQLPNRLEWLRKLVRLPEDCLPGWWIRACSSWAARTSGSGHDCLGTSSRGPTCCSWCGNGGRRIDMGKVFHLQKRNSEWITS